MPEWVSVCVVSLLLSLLTVAGLIVYSRLLSHITVRTGPPPLKKITFAYKFKQGPYRSCEQFFRESHSIGPKLSCIGVFYDEPKKVSGPQCRFAVGSILSEGETKPDEELLKRYETSGFNVFSFPEVTHVVTTSFPHKTFFSLLLRVGKVYPQLEHYIKDRRLCAHPLLEIYREGQIHFMAPLARQGDFYVPEVRQRERRLSDQEESYSDTDVSVQSTAFGPMTVNDNVTGSHAPVTLGSTQSGADSNSEYSSGSGVLLTDSRETSPAGSSVHSASGQDQGDSDLLERGSRGISFKELDWEQTDEKQEDGEEQLHEDSNQKSLEVPTVKWWGVVGGEE